jgi:hypothetical protein
MNHFAFLSMNRFATVRTARAALFGFALSLALAACGDDDATDTTGGDNTDGADADSGACKKQADCGAKAQCGFASDCEICDGGTCEALWSGVSPATAFGNATLNNDVEADLLDKHPNCYKRFTLLSTKNVLGAPVTCQTIDLKNFSKAAFNVIFERDNQTISTCGVALQNSQDPMSFPYGVDVVIIGELLSSSAQDPTTPGAKDTFISRQCLDGFKLTNGGNEEPGGFTFTGNL